MAKDQSQAAPYVFLSYASADRTQALRIADVLESHGVAVWIDRKSIAGGTSWGKEIVRGIRGCATVAVLATAAALRSRNVQQEIQVAWEHDRPILPLLLEPTDIPEDVEYALAGRQWIEVLDRAEEDWLPLALRALQGLGIEPGPSVPGARPATAPFAVGATRPPRHNLPVQVTSFVGREKELAEIKRLLATTHLLTLTGVGGAGKTRLALQTAAELLADYPDGVWFVELAPLTQPELVVGTVARVIGIHEEAGQPVVNTLSSALGSRQVLLLLDNCEHLVDACARLVDTLIRVCPNLRILATSREVLGIPGETTFRVPPLTLADSAQPPALDRLKQCEALRLFVDRASSVQPDFVLTDANAPSVARICEALDGIPLAIELAAAQVRVLSPEQIAARLGDRFRLLKGGSRTALPRQQTLRALIDWSFDLLSAPEKVLLRRLSVFVGGWTLGAAELVCAAEPIEPADVLGLLTELVDKSLVLTEAAPAGEVRYRLLETLREYGAEKLAEAGELALLGRQHAAHFRDLAEQLSDRVHGPDQVATFEGLQRELDNFRAAIKFSLHSWPGPDGADCARRVTAALGWFWILRGHWREAIERCEEVLGLPETDEAPTWSWLMFCAIAGSWATDDYAGSRRKIAQLIQYADEHGDQETMTLALYSLSLQDLRQGKYVAAQTNAAKSLAHADTLGETLGPWWRVLLQQANGHACLYQGRAAEAEPWYARALDLAREQQDQRGVALSLYYLGLAAMYLGQLARASSLFTEGEDLFRRIGEPRHVGDIVAKQATLASQAKDLDRARELYQQALLTRTEIGDRRGIAECLTAFAGLARANGEQREICIRLLAAAAELRSRIAVTVSEPERRDIEQMLEWARSTSAADAFTANWEAGRSMSQEAATHLALEIAGSENRADRDDPGAC